MGFSPTISEEAFLNREVNTLTDNLFEQARTNYDEKFSIVKQMIMPVVNRVYNDPSNTFTKIAIPFVDGSKGMEIGADLEEAINTQGNSIVKEIEKAVSLALIDNIWKEHLRDMDELKDQTQSASFEQKDPLVVYKNQAFKLFEQLLDRINKEIASFLFRGLVPVQNPDQVSEAKEINVDNSQVKTNIEKQKEAEEAMRRAAQQAGQSRQQEKPKTFKRVDKKVGRNEPCPCGSGKKFKQCHGKS